MSGAGTPASAPSVTTMPSCASTSVGRFRTARSRQMPLCDLAERRLCATSASSERSAAPAGAVAPQPVDASDQGALAFVCFAIMCGLIAASLFYMDRVRKRRTGED